MQPASYVYRRVHWIGRLAAGVGLAVVLAAAADYKPAETLIENGHWKRARALLEPNVAASPNDAQALFLLSRVKFAFGDVNAAVSLCEKAIALDAHQAAYHKQLFEYVGTQAQKAGVLRQMGLARRAKKEADTALSLNPNDPETLEGLMQYLWQAPGFVGGDKNKAREMAQRIHEIDPVAGYHAEAELAALQKETGKLEDLYQKAVHANPRSYAAHFRLASFYSGRGQTKYDQVEKHARAALPLGPDKIGPYTLLARLYGNQGREADLQAILAQSERTIADNLSPYLTAGNALLAAGKDLPRAEAYLRKYLTQEPEGNSPSLGITRWRLALVLEKQGRRKEAAVEMDAAHRAEPQRKDIEQDWKRLKR
jgi:tetratricopeptide (TPR) repeat protein